EIEAPVVRLDAFAGGWVEAMTPYRSWYRETFADSLALRDAMTWADRIRVVIDTFPRTDPAAVERLAGQLPPDTVLLHDWNARQATFDRELPDWTPREGYVERVRTLQALGFRSMA